MLGPRRRHVLRQRVQALLDQFNVSLPPVPVEDIAQRLGFTLLNKRFGDSKVSGFYLRKGADRVIGVNALHHPNRRRFTVAHELGHALMAVHDDLHVDGALKLRDAGSATGEDRAEVEANAFAAELLMPVEMLRAELDRRGGIDIEDSAAVQSLAERFGVSRQALLIRLGSRAFFMATSRAGL